MRIRADISTWSHLLIVLSLLTAVVYWAQSLLKPIAFAVILALLLRPVCSYLEKKKIPTAVAILFTLASLILVVFSLLTLFSAQLIFLFRDLQDFQSKILLMMAEIQILIFQNLPLSEAEMTDLTRQGKSQLLSLSGTLLAPTLGASGNLLASTGLTLVYVFFFLLYRKSILAFILLFQAEEKKERTRQFLIQVNRVIIRYFIGLLMVILIMGGLNSLGLWLIGVEHPLLFGFFAAGLTIIPYLGTYIGGALPVLFVVLTRGEWLPGVYVAGWFILVQALESNWITPRIIGNQVSVNALFAFMALIIGGLLWGVAGMILFIPFTAVLKILFDHSDSLRGLGLLLGNEFSSRSTDEPDKWTNGLRRFFE